MIRLLLALLLSTPTLARAAPVCTPPARIETPRPDGPTAEAPARQAKVVGYTLALSWSPEYCHGKRSAGGFQCAGPLAGRFVLHGLWPNAADPRRWPQYCRPAAILPEAVLRANLCTTPSEQLLQHEWAKHGTCVADRPESYFAAARAAFEAIRFPSMSGLASDRSLSAGLIQRAFAAANPGTSATAYRIQLNRRGWLQEVHVCLDLRRRAVPCPAGAKGAPAGARVRIERGERSPPRR